MATEERLAHLEELAKLVRYYILVSIKQAGSGHPTSSLSAADLMVGLMFGGKYRYFVDEPRHPNNDRLIFSKGHAFANSFTRRSQRSFLARQFSPAGLPLERGKGHASAA